LARAERADIPVTVDQLDSHSLSGGNVEPLVEAMIAARARASIRVPVLQATELVRLCGIPGTSREPEA
jgi:uncharacterized protein YqfA (UPF0365 family)